MKRKKNKLRHDRSRRKQKILTPVLFLFLLGIFLAAIFVFFRKSSPSTQAALFQELVTNGSFELDADSDRIPDGWQWNFDRLASNEGRVCDTAHSGSCSFRINGHPDKTLTQTINMAGEAGKTYTFSIWSKGEQFEEFISQFAYVQYVFFYDAAGNITDQADVTLLNPTENLISEFRRWQTTFTTTKPFNSIKIVLSFTFRKSYAWFDDVSLMESPAPTATPTPVETIPPTATITNPIDGGTVKANSWVTIKVSAYDNVGISKVVIYISSFGTWTDEKFPYEVQWVVPPKKNVKYTISATAFDLYGNQSPVSTVTVTSAVN